MSVRTLSRFMLTTLLAAAFVAPAAAQEPMPQAPMPRAKVQWMSTPSLPHLWWDEDYHAEPAAPKPQNRIEIQLKFGAPAGLELKWSVERAPVCSAAHEAVIPACRGVACLPCPFEAQRNTRDIVILRQVVFGEGVQAPRPSMTGNFGSYCSPLPPPKLPVLPGMSVVGVGGPPCLPPVAPPVAHSIRNNPPDAMKLMAADAFGEMLLQSGVTAPQCLPTPPRVLTITTAAQPMPGTIGTWYREIGARRCVVKIAGDHMTITVSESRELDGKPVTLHVTFTADYHMMRDGHTAAGLITSADMTCEGELTDADTQSLLESLTEFRKAMEDKPFAMSCRMYGDTLVIGNVRMPKWKNEREQPSAYIGGRYTNATTKPLPALKTIKAESGMALPSPQYVDRPRVTVPMPGCPLPNPIEFTGPACPKHVAGPPLVLPPGSSVIPVEFSPSDVLPPMAAPQQPVIPVEEFVPPMPPAGYVVPSPMPLPVVPPMAAPTPVVPSMSEPVPSLPPLSPSPGSSFLRGLNTTAKPDHRQLFNFSTGLFGSQ